MSKILTLSTKNKNYPIYLKRIPNHPDIIYIRGNLDALLQPAIAIVGSRAMTIYGEKACKKIVSELVQQGFTIVSGLATGIDATAHRTALDLGGSTIAVLAHGLKLENTFPTEHQALAERIINHDGLLLSEYPPPTVARRFHFPARNRIIAALCLGTVVVEAREKSGALITARHALENNREVFAIPGPIFSSRARGVNKLLRDGAVLVESATDILNELPIESKLNAIKLAQTATFTDEQQKIINLMNDGFSKPDKISEMLQITTASLASNLTELEIKGIVRRNIDYSYSLSL
ncbi:MAG: DNA-processing protein DprA [bacterium]|nr:DNA-processing protein DprA [bacterium]